jgi:hypothetical protein
VSGGERERECGYSDEKKGRIEFWKKRNRKRGGKRERGIESNFKMLILRRFENCE